MIFTELRFLFFFLVAFGVHWALRSNEKRKVWLLVCSYAFYSVWNWKFLSLIIVSTLVDYVAGARIHALPDGRARKAWLCVSLFVNLALLGTFKYLDFFIQSTADFLLLLGFQPNLELLKWTLPVGISFYTFQTLSYSLDIYFRRLKPVERLLDLATFVAFFPQLVAGPIVRAADFLPQLTSARRFTDVAVRSHLVLFLVGFFKKACVSDNITTIVDSFYASPETYDTFGTWIGMVAFSIQIYCDFSGYSDMAIACAGLLGYELRLNFDFPYLTSNIQDFWRQWHISLSSWLRDYIYIPLGGNRGSEFFTNKNLLITMLIAGVWHGAGWTFVAFGFLHGAALVAYREWSKRFPATGHNAARALFAGVLTFLFVTYVWVFFRAPDFETAWTVTLHALALAETGSQTFGAGPVYFFGGLLVLHVILRMGLLRPAIERAPELAFAIGYGAAVPVVLAFMNGAVQPFIYFQF